MEAPLSVWRVELRNSKGDWMNVLTRSWLFKIPLQTFVTITKLRWHYSHTVALICLSTHTHIRFKTESFLYNIFLHYCTYLYRTNKYKCKALFCTYMYKLSNFHWNCNWQRYVVEATVTRLSLIAYVTCVRSCASDWVNNRKSFISGGHGRIN